MRQLNLTPRPRDQESTPDLAAELESRHAVFCLPGRDPGSDSLNMPLRKIIKTRGSFPNDEAAMKLLCLALGNAAKKWTMPIPNWREASNRFAILWPELMSALDQVS